MPTDSEKMVDSSARSDSGSRPVLEERKPLLSGHGSPNSHSSTSLQKSGYSRRPMHYSSINSSTRDMESTARDAAVISRYKYYRRLAPPHDNTMAMPDHVVPAEYWTALPIQPEGKQNSLITIFSIWNTMMGTSLLSMPWAIGQAGLILGIALMVFMGFLTLYTSYRVMKSVSTISHQGGEILEFSDVCKHYLGRFGEISAVMFSVITLLGGAIVYWVLMSNFMYNTVLFVHNKVEEGPHSHPDILNYSQYHDDYIHCKAGYDPDSHVAHAPRSTHVIIGNTTDNTSTTLAPPATISSFLKYWDLQKTVPFYLLLVLLPLINFKSPTFFTKFNALGTISVLYLLGFVTYKSIAWGVHMDFTKVPGKLASPSFAALTGVLCLAFFIHNCVLSIVRNQAKPENNARDLTIAFILTALTYMYVGVMFYIAWPMINKACIAQNLLDNLLTADPTAFIARIFLFIQMLTVFPLLLYIMRIQVMHTAFGSVWPSWKHVLALNIVVVGVCVIFARFIPQIGSIIRYTGAFCGLVYAFFLPCATYLLSERRQGRLTPIKLILHSSIVVIGLANFIAQFFVQE